MNKQDFQQISEIFDDISFIERLEQMAKNSGNGQLLFMAAPALPRINVNCLHAGTSTMIVIPENLSQEILSDMIAYKDSMKEMLDGLCIVDKSALPDNPEDNQNTDDTKNEESSED